MGGGNPVGTTGVRLKLSGQDELKREARKLAAELNDIFQRSGAGGFGYASKLLSGKAVSSSERRSGFAEMDYVRQVTDADFRERLRNSPSTAERQRVRDEWQQTRATIGQARTLGGLAQPVASGGGAGSGLGPFHPLRLGLGFIRGLVGFGAIGAPTYYVARALRGMMTGEYDREAAVANTMNRLAPEGMGLGGLTALTRGGGVRAGMMPSEFTRFVGGMGAAAGATATPLASQAAMLSRVFGLSPGRGAQIFGAEARMGADTVEMQKKFAGYIAEAVQHGRMRGREGEVFESIQKATEGLADFFGTTGAQNLSMQAAMAGNMGVLANTRIPGLEGAAGMAALVRANSAIAGTSVLNMPDMLTPITAMMMQRHGGDIVGKMRFQQNMLLGPNAQEDRQNLIEMFNMAHRYGKDAGVWQLAMQMGGPVMAQAAAAFTNPGKGMSPTQALSKSFDQYQKDFSQAQKEQQQWAEWKKAEAEAGHALIPVMVDFTKLMLQLIPGMLKLTTWISGFVGRVEKEGVVSALSSASGDLIKLSASGYTGVFGAEYDYIKSTWGTEQTKLATLRDVTKTVRMRRLKRGISAPTGYGGGDMTYADAGEVPELFRMLTGELGMTPQAAIDLIEQSGYSDVIDYFKGISGTSAAATRLPGTMPLAIRHARMKRGSWKSDHASTPSTAAEATSFVEGKGGTTKATTVVIHADHAVVHSGADSHHGTATARTLLGTPIR